MLTQRRAERVDVAGALAVIDRLRDELRHAPRRRAGCIELGGITFHYADGPSFYSSYKDIFHHRIYDFEARRRPVRIIDGGACTGVAMSYFKSAYPDAEVVCFEPDAQIRALLARNIAANGFDGVTVVPAGLSDSEADCAFEPDGVVVDVRCLSMYLDRPVDLVKLNIEGHELAVLQEVEAAGRLGRIDQLVVAYHGWGDAPPRLGSLLHLLERNGFRYVVHDFGGETGPASKPPFRVGLRCDWCCLVYARNERTAKHDDMLSAPAVHDWRALRRTTPVSRVFGLDRGRSIDRWYIEQFLEAHCAAVRGRVLEVAEDTYTRRYGGARVTHVDVLHVEPDDKGRRLVGNLETGEGIPVNAYDCIVLTQTLLVLFDVRAAVEHLYRALAPGGIVLATVPGISQISRYDMDRWGDYWRFTSLSVRRLFGEVFGDDRVAVAAHGNVLAATAFLHGLADHELTAEELAARDCDYELIITVRAVKAGRRS